MSLPYIRSRYGVPADLGRRIIYTGDGREEPAIIVGSYDARIRVIFDACPGIYSLHPTWKVEYLEPKETE